MNILPYENVTYKTHLSKEEIIKRLSRETEPKQMFRVGAIFGNHKEYEGTVSNSSFKIQRIISYRNSFLPQIIGNIREEKGYTSIEITMRLRNFVIIFIMVWMIIFLLLSPFFIPLFFREVESKFVANLASYTPFLMLIFIYIISTLSFKIESNTSKLFFERLFEAEKLDSNK